MKEHSKKIDIFNGNEDAVSAITLHSVKKHGLQPDLKDWGIQILDKEGSTQNRRLLEAIWIYHLHPELNRHVGVKIIMKDQKF